MIDVATFLACMIFVSMVGFGLYRHFSFLFEMQYELTNQLIQEIKPRIPDSSDSDFLYGVSYEVGSDEES